MNKTLARTGAVVTAALGLTLTVATPALASADKCRGDAFESCVAVNGSKLHVNSIKSRVALYSKTCRYGHSQVLINGKHYADSNGGKDKDYCSTSIFGAEVTTGTWNVNRNYAKGTQICSKFWWSSGSTKPGTVNGYTSFGTASFGPSILFLVELVSSTRSYLLSSPVTRGLFQRYGAGGWPRLTICSARRDG